MTRYFATYPKAIWWFVRRVAHMWPQNRSRCPKMHFSRKYRGYAARLYDGASSSQWHADRNGDSLFCSGMFVVARAEVCSRFRANIRDCPANPLTQLVAFVGAFGVDDAARFITSYLWHNASHLECSCGGFFLLRTYRVNQDNV